ncbi:MAG: hypothetical protein M9894_21220 [Planctomycetes bacterium]|nr:hypothetical protein [Planctomycetota bacterium]
MSLGLVVARSLLGAVLLAAAGALVGLSEGDVVPVDVLLGAALGLLAGPLALGERAARHGRPWAALVWCAGLGVVGVLVAAVQVGFVARLLVTGGVAGAYDDAYLAVWQAALDPATLRAVLARAAPFALVAPLAGGFGWRGLVLGVVLGGALVPIVAVTAGAGAVSVERSARLGPRPADAAWALPTGAGAPRPCATAFSYDQEYPQQVPARAVLFAAALDALALAACVLAGRRRDARSRHLPLPRALPALATLALAALAVLGGRPPPAYLVDPLLDALRPGPDPAWGLLRRLGPADAAAAPILAARLQDPSPLRRELAADLLGRLGPAAASALPAIERALLHPNRDVRLDALDALPGLGPAARPLRRAFLRLFLAEHLDTWPLEDPTRLTRLLDDLGGEPDRDELVALAFDDEVDVAANALERLWKRGELDPSLTPRVLALARLPSGVGILLRAEHVVEPARAHLDALLDDPELDGRAAVLWVLFDRDVPPPLLVRAARHGDDQVRERAAEALASSHRQADAWALDLLVSLVDDPARPVVQAATNALASHRADGLAALTDEVAAGAPRARAALAALGRTRTAWAGEAVLPLARALDEGDSSLRPAIVATLADLAGVAPGEARHHAAQALAHATRDPALAPAALTVLRAYPALAVPAAREVLVAALDGPRPDLRARAALALLLCEDRQGWREGLVAQHRPALGRALEDALTDPAWPLPTVAVLEALRAFGPDWLDLPGALGAVGRGASEGRDYDACRLALGLLLEAGPRAGPVAADLVSALSSRHPELRRWAANALRKLDSDALAPHRAALEARRRAEREDGPTAMLLEWVLHRLREAE